MWDSIYLPRTQGSFLPPPAPGYRTVGLSWSLIWHGQWVLHPAAGDWPRGSPGVHLGAILRKFEKRFWLFSAGPDPPVELLVGGARQWGVPPPVVRPAFSQLPDVHAQTRLCYGSWDKDARMYALDCQPKTVEEAVGQMQFFQHSRQATAET